MAKPDIRNRIKRVKSDFLFIFLILWEYLVIST